MLEFINRIKLTPFLFLAPAIWMTTGMLWDGDGDMRLVPIVLIVAAISIALFRFEVIKDNFKNSFWIKLLLINSLFGVMAYEFYGFDSRELRATLIIFFLLIATPKIFYTKNTMQWLLFVASVSCCTYSYYYQIHVSLARGYWPINAIPFATICGLIGTSCLGLIFSNFKEKRVALLIISTVLVWASLLLSQSRGPLIAMIVVTSVLLLYISYKKNKFLSLCVLLGLIVATLGVSNLPVIKGRIHNTVQEFYLIQNGDYSSSLGFRLQMFRVGSELWKKKPILGYGKEVKSEFNRLEEEGIITSQMNWLISMTFHNGYLDKFVLYGVLGGGIFLVFIFYPISISRKYSIENGTILLWAPAFFISICNLSDAPFINAQVTIYYMYTIGIVIMMLSNEKERE